MSTSETIKEKRKQAVKLVEEIQVIVKDLKDNQELFNALSRQIKVKDKDFTTTLVKLNNLSNSLKDIYQKIQDDKTKIIVQLNDAESFYNKKYLPLLQKINDPANGFKAKIKTLESTEVSIKRISNICAQKFSVINTATNNFKKQALQLNRVIKRIEGLELKASNIQTKIDSIHKNIIEIEKKSKIILNTFHNDQDSSKKILSQIENVKLESDNTLAKIIDNQSVADERLVSIQKIYDIAHETGLSGEFERRRNQHNIARLKWGRYVFATALTLLLLLIGFYIGQLTLYNFKLDSTTFDFNFYIRYLILSPVVYYLYFAATQYSKERRLFEKYSFKTTLAMSIKSHIELLLSQPRFQNDANTNQIINFVLDGFRTIYNEPYENNDFNVKLKLTDIELNLQKKIFEHLGFEKITPPK